MGCKTWKSSLPLFSNRRFPSGECIRAALRCFFEVLASCSVRAGRRILHLFKRERTNQLSPRNRFLWTFQCVAKHSKVAKRGSTINGLWWNCCCVLPRVSALCMTIMSNDRPNDSIRKQLPALTHAKARPYSPSPLGFTNQISRHDQPPC